MIPRDESANAEIKSVKEDMTKEPASVPEAIENPVEPLEDAPAPVILVFPWANVEKTKVPIANCKTWESMKNSIQRAITLRRHWPELIPLLNKGDGIHGGFDLIRTKPEEEVILSKDWEQIVEPGLEVSIDFYYSVQSEYPETLGPDQPSVGNDLKTSSQEVSDKKGTIYELRTAYTVAYYGREDTTSADLVFDQEKTYTQPFALTTSESRSETRTVLEEIRGFYPVSEVGRNHSGPDPVTEGSIGPPILHIQSRILLNALSAVVQFFDAEFDARDLETERRKREAAINDHITNLDDGLFPFPFKDLYYHMDELRSYQKESRGPRSLHTQEYNEECDAHIDVLLDYLHNQPSVKLAAAEQMWSQPVPSTEFRWVWLLLKPGSDVFYRENGELNVYVIETVKGGLIKGGRFHGRATPYRITMWNLDFNGSVLSRTLKIVTIPVFDGAREICSLQIYPTRFHKEGDGEPPIQEKLVERGKKFVKLVKQPSFQQYTGPGLYQMVKKHEQTRTIIDHSSSPWVKVEELGDGCNMPCCTQDHEEHEILDLGSRARVPECRCVACQNDNSGAREFQPVKFSDYDNIDLNKRPNLTDHQYLLCRSHVYGFMLKDRLFELIKVDGLTEPRIQKNIIDTLVMKPESNKRMIKAICETYSNVDQRSNLFFADFIQGKGEGQIMLLHGPPGTGKTLTAESVAEYTGRPLLSITAADLGDSATDLENNLLGFFRDATKWDAIVLLDEADVYLEGRSTNDLTRNSIVSIFLRALDYFQGILFLTTNRVGSFDEAFLSRIHIQIGYETLDEEARQQIWANSFRKLAANHEYGGRKIVVDSEAKSFVKKSRDLKALKWNGREIRNAFQTAVALASFDAKENDEDVPRITDDHLSQVVEMSAKFKEYMVKTHGGLKDADIAYKDGLRHDESEVPEGRERIR